MAGGGRASPPRWGANDMPPKAACRAPFGRRAAVLNRARRGRHSLPNASARSTRRAPPAPTEEVPAMRTLRHLTAIVPLALSLSLLSPPAAAQHHQPSGKVDYDPDPGGGDPNVAAGCPGAPNKVVIS